MYSLTPRFLSIFLLLMGSSIAILAQNSAINKGTATISGRIMIGDQPASGIEVILRSMGGGGTIIIAGLDTAPTLTATTDAEGRYKITNIAAGNYRIAAHAPAYVSPGESSNRFDA